MNPAFEELTGLKDVIGKRVSEVIPDLLQADPEIIQSYGRVASTGVPERFETHVSALDLWLSLSVYSPCPEHFAVLFDNITEQRTEALLASEERFDGTSSSA